MDLAPKDTAARSALGSTMETGRELAGGGRRRGDFSASRSHRARSDFARALALSGALGWLLVGCEPNVPASEVRTGPAPKPASRSVASPAPVPVARVSSSSIAPSQAGAALPAIARPAESPSASAAPVTSDSAAIPSALVTDVASVQLTSQGFLANVPTPDPDDGAPFPIPDPLPECSRPVACDIAPPPRVPGGIVLRVLMKKGMEPGELAYARAIAGARDGSAYYLVDKLGRLQKLDRDLHVRAIARTPEIARGKPTGLYVAASGELWVSDTHYSRVLVYSPDLQLKRAWGAPGDKLGGFLFLRDVKERGDGALLAADYGDETARIQVFQSEGQALFQFGKFGAHPGEFQRPMKVAIDLEHKELFVADSVNHRIQVLAFDGKPIREFGGLGSEPGQLKYPYDILLDEKGRVWVAEFGNHRLQVFSHEGKSLGMWGKAGRGEGELAFPWGLALEPEGRLLLLDSGNDRIYELDRSAILRAGEAK